MSIKAVHFQPLEDCVSAPEGSIELSMRNHCLNRANCAARGTNTHCRACSATRLHSDAALSDMRRQGIARNNRTAEQRARMAERTIHRNTGNTHRLGKHAIPDETVAAMSAMRQRGLTYGQIGLRFGMSRSAARHLVSRRGQDIAA